MFASFELCILLNENKVKVTLDFEIKFTEKKTTYQMKISI